LGSRRETRNQAFTDATEPDHTMAFDLITLAPYAAGILFLVVFAAFVLELRSPDAVAFCGAATALAIGLVKPDNILAALANPAPAIIGAMFVLSAALVRTSVLETLSNVLGRYASTRPDVLCSKVGVLT
jgi:Na+/H+ antiporter NhaD/arsenite permease-like protein